MNKKRIILALVFVLVFFLGGIAGRVYQHLKTGYHHKILKTESFPFPDGEVKLSYTSESIGMPFFLDPERSVLTVTTKHGFGLPITVYKAKRMFQESFPHVQDVSTETNRISWNDGLNVYRLTIEPIEESKDKLEPSTEGDGLKPAP